MSGRGGKRSTSFKPGRSGNPGGRPKAIQSLVDLARAETEEAIKALVLIRDTKDAPAAARLAASNALLDRGWGKPGVMIFQNVDEMRTVRDWSTAELIAFLDDCKANKRGET